MSTRGLVLWISAALLAAGIAAAQESKTEELRTAVSPMTGDIRVWRAAVGKPEKLVPSSLVSPDDHLGTPNRATARLIVGSEVVVTLKGVEAGAEEGLSVASRDKKVQLKLYRGKILVESFDVDVAVDTPAGRVEGTSVALVVEVTEEGTRIVPVDGRPKVTNSLGSLDAGPGETVVMKKGGAPSKKRSAAGDADVGWSGESDGSANLIQNPGFEDGLKSWLAVTVNGKPFAKLDHAVVHGGKASLRIDLQNESLVGMVVDSGFDAGNCAVYQNKQFLPGKYLLRMWVRTENYTARSKEAALSISLGGAPLVCPPAAGQWRSARFIVELTPNEYARLRFPVNPEGSKEVVLSGTVWVDDISLVPLPPSK